MIRLGETRYRSSRLLETVYTSGNVYHVKKVCLVCGLAIRNSKSSHGIVCIDTKPDGSKDDRSQCQSIHYRNLENRRRVRQKEEQHKATALTTSQEAMRECLRCPIDDETGKGVLFLSKSPSNRTCEACSNKEGSINVSKLSNIGKDVPGCDFVFGFND